jgi:serine/threonine protein kinase
VAEQKNLKAFKRCLEQNKNIMQSFTAFLHGSDFTIISPLADLDLLTYFKGRYPDFDSRSRGFTPAHLLNGAACLAGALRFLHEGLQPVGISEKIYCAHLDLKPENVLVIWPKGPNEPAGRWLVHDFGTSKIKEGRHSRSSTTLVAPGDFIRHFSPTEATRTPGAFQAPEVQATTERVVGTESDMWSLGCILAVVLAFAVGGPPSVTKLANSRSHEEFIDDYFYIKDGNRFSLKDKVSTYLKSLASGPGGNTWIKETLDLIYKTLVENPHSRPSAKVVQDTLATIYRRQDQSLSDPCFWIPKELPCPPPELAPRVGPPERLMGPEGQARLERVGRGETPNPHRRGPDLPNVIVRSPTMPNQGFEEQPGLEVVSPTSPLSSPRSGSMSQWQSDVESIHRESRILSSGISRNSSISTRPVSLTEDVTFIRLLVPKHTFKSIICPQSCHVAFLSKKQTSIMRLLDNDWTSSQKCSILNAGYLQACTKDCPDPFEWDDGCMSGPYMVLRVKRTGGRDRKVGGPALLLAWLTKDLGIPVPL